MFGRRSTSCEDRARELAETCGAHLVRDLPPEWLARFNEDKAARNAVLSAAYELALAMQRFDGDPQQVVAIGTAAGAYLEAYAAATRAILALTVPASADTATRRPPQPETPTQ